MFHVTIFEIKSCKKYTRCVFSHDRTCIYIVVAKHGRNPLLRVTHVVARESVAHVSDVSGRGSFVVDLRSIWVVHEVLRDVRPELGPLPCALDPLQHLVRLDVARHRHPVQRPVHHQSLHT